MRNLLVASFLFVACSETASKPTQPISIPDQAEPLRAELVEIRRDLHRHPELSKSESRTASVVAGHLRGLGLEVRTGVGGHGVIGILRGADPGPVVGYRADMDAMPDQEPEGRPYGSTVPGVFHICGHDLHVAIGIGVAKTLASVRNRMRGTAVFFFQPAEETLEGAAAMLANDALALRPEAMYAVHVWPFPVGTIAPGATFAGRDAFTIDLEGEQAKKVADVEASLAPLGTVHRPETPAESMTILGDFQTPNGPLSTFVFLDTSSSVEGTHARIEGSVKASSDAMYPDLHIAIQRAIERVVPAGAYRLDFPSAPFPSMASDPAIAAEAAAVLESSLGKSNVISLHAAWPFNGEDFALFLKQIPGTMFLLGISNPERGILGAPHSPDFDADEDAIMIGTKAMSEVLWSRLSDLHR